IESKKELKSVAKISQSKSSHVFDEVPSVVQVPMASFEQDLDDDFTYHPTPSSNPTTTEREWTCKKCTLVNSSTSSVCIVCGGSKLKSISSVEDMTLRKGEFWTCSQCTLKNTLAQNTCSACKHVRETPIISGQLSNFRPYTEQNNIVAPTNSSHKTSQNNNRQQQLNLTNTTSTILSPSSPGLQPPSNRTSRSPSPRHERYSGAIPKSPLMNLENFIRFMDHLHSSLCSVPIYQGSNPGNIK
uniref:RanBP2-type domain-containing protein n=1 Tax=Megaselia scalaris TaxID=36166 RepID=T1GE22_MEGSC